METTKIQKIIPMATNGNGKELYKLSAFEQNAVEDEDESVDLRQLWSVVKHRMPLMIGVMFSVTSAVAFWTFKQTPIYEGKFELLIEPPISQQNNTGAAASTQALMLFGVPVVDYSTQIEVLLSPSVLEPILAKIAKRYPDVTYQLLLPEDKKPRLTIAQYKDTKILEIIYNDSDPEKIKYILNELSKGFLDYSIKQRKSQVQQGLEFTNKQLPKLRKRVDSMQRELQALREKYTFFDPDLQAQTLSQQILALETKYLDNQVLLNQNISLYGLLQEQLGLAPNQAMAASYLSESPRYQKLLEELQKVEVQLAIESSQFLDESPNIQTLKEKRDNLLPLLEEEAKNVLGDKLLTNVANSPALASPSQLRLELNQKYIEAANQIQILQLSKKTLEQARKTFMAQVQQIPLIARKYTDLKQELSIAIESLNSMMQAEQSLQLESAQQVLPWEIISKPTQPEEPISPEPVRNIALGLFGGFFLGLGAAFLAERLDPVFHSSEELKESFQLPILGLIPQQKNLDSVNKALKIGTPQIQIGGKKLKVEDAEAKARQIQGNLSSPFLESFRSLSTNIRLLGSDSPINTLVISSSAPSEGKSTVSLNLCKAAAAMGQRVLLIDADLRRPQVHVRLGLHNKQGLSNVIAMGADLHESIQKVPDVENFFVLSAGDIPPDPTRLLSSKKMKEVMIMLQEDTSFDLVIYDTPPVLGFADGRILATHTNGVILVAKLGQTDRTAFKQTVDQLKISQVPILGLVANNVPRSNQGSYYYHYYGRR